MKREELFWHDTIDVFHLRTKVGNPSAKCWMERLKCTLPGKGVLLQQFKSSPKSQSLTHMASTDQNNKFPHYVAIIYFLIESWQKRDMQTTDFLVGKFTIQMRPNDLYCCPIKKDEQDINLHDRRAFLCNAEKHQHVSIRNVLRQFGSTWMGTMTKSIVISRLLKTPLHYVQFCSLKWSGILTCFFTTSSWCSTWSHGRSFMTIIPCDRRIMERGSSKQDQVIVPEKVKQREEKNLFSCVKNIMRRQEKRGTLFHSAPENEEARNWCQLCFILCL